MKKIIPVFAIQILFLTIGLISIITIGGIKPGITGQYINVGENTGYFIEPYINGKLIIRLEHTKTDQNTFHIKAEIGEKGMMVHNKIYYYDNNGWQEYKTSDNQWVSGPITINLEDQYNNYQTGPADDFYLAAWVCESKNNQWECGCKQEGDCGYWHLQGINLEQEEKTPEPCNDQDNDGYGSPGTETCQNPEEDCDDQNSNINPGMNEIPYNNKDDDCNQNTKDDDLDNDGYLIINDCDDKDNNINPSGTETCQDGIDQDCSGNDEQCQQCGEGEIPTTGCSCSGNPYHQGYCCDNNWQSTPCGTPETIFYDGYESGTGNTWDYLSPNSQVNQDVAKTGQYSLNIIYEQGKNLQKAEKNIMGTEKNYIKTDHIFEEDFKQPINDAEIMKIQGDDWDTTIKTRMYQGDIKKGEIIININGEEESTEIIINNGEWNCYEIEADKNNGITIWVNNIQQYQKTTTLGTSDLNKITLGGTYSDSITSTQHEYYDNTIISKVKTGC